MPNLRGASPIGHDEGDHSYAVQKVGRKRSGSGEGEWSRWRAARVALVFGYD